MQPSKTTHDRVDAPAPGTEPAPQRIVVRRLDRVETTLNCLKT